MQSYGSPVVATKTFEEVFSWEEGAALKTRTIIYEVPGWWLYYFKNGEYYVAHGCAASFGGDRWDYRSSCIKCGAHPPDEFITVATLIQTPKGRTTYEDRV